MSLAFFAKNKIAFKGLDFILYSHLDFFFSHLFLFLQVVWGNRFAYFFFFLYKSTQILFLFITNIFMFGYLQNKIHLQLIPVSEKKRQRV